jgi:hypothetical protein
MILLKWARDRRMAPAPQQRAHHDADVPNSAYAHHGARRRAFLQPIGLGSDYDILYNPVYGRLLSRGQ